MNEVMLIVLENLEKVGIGIVLFVAAYLSNMGLGAWKSCQIDGFEFDWKLMVKSLIKFGILVGSIGLLSIVVSLIPVYMNYIGAAFEETTIQAIDGIVIVSAFLTATIRYAVDAIGKIKVILGIGE